MSESFVIQSLPNSVTNSSVKIVFLDVNLFYSLNDNRLLVQNEYSVNNQLANLLFTEPGEVEFEPQFGSLVNEIIFDNPGPLMDWILENKVFECVVTYMNFINIDYSNSFIAVGANEVGEAYMRIAWNIPNIIPTPQTVEIRYNN